MKKQIQSLLLIFILLAHSVWGVAMATQMQLADLMSGTPGISAQQHMTQSANSAHCPHSKQTSTQASAPDSEQAETGSCGDCSECMCLGALGSVIIPHQQTAVPFTPSFHGLVFLSSAFPESPPDYLLRPPIAC